MQLTRRETEPIGAAKVNVTAGSLGDVTIMFIVLPHEINYFKFTTSD